MLYISFGKYCGEILLIQQVVADNTRVARCSRGAGPQSRREPALGELVHRICLDEHPFQKDFLGN